MLLTWCDGITFHIQFLPSNGKRCENTTSSLFRLAFSWPKSNRDFLALRLEVLDDGRASRRSRDKYSLKVREESRRHSGSVLLAIEIGQKFIRGLDLFGIQHHADNWRNRRIHDQSLSKEMMDATEEIAPSLFRFGLSLLQPLSTDS